MSTHADLSVTQSSSQATPAAPLFTLGVNYWPRRKAMYWWSDFDATEIDEEFAVIAELGLSVVRIFLLWDDFQPEPTSVSAEALRSLGSVCDLAAKHKLGLDITFFTGHMSGPNWAPRWLLDGPPLPYVQQLISRHVIVESGYRNPFTDPQALTAEKLLLRTVVTAFKDHPAVWMWNLGNEPDLFATPPTAALGRAWVRDLVTLIREIDPVHPVTCGLHSDSLHRDNGLRIEQVYGETDVAVMHSYPMYAAWSRSPLDPDFVPFTCALVTALSGKPTLMEEFGGCTAAPNAESFVWEWTAYGKPRTQFMASEHDFAAYIEAVLTRLHQTGVTGAMLWCFADYIPELWGKPPCSESRHERFFGLVRPDGSLKPHAEVIKKFAATKPRVLPIPDAARFTVDPAAYYADPMGKIEQLYHRWLDSIATL